MSSYFVNNAFTTSFNKNEPITINTTAVNLPTDTIYMARLKEGETDYLTDSESLYFSDGAAYSELHFTKPNTVLHSGSYEAQLHLRSLFSGYQCNSIYSTFLFSSTYLGISNGFVILQSTVQRLAYYGKWLCCITKPILFA